MARIIKNKDGVDTYLFIHIAKTGGTFFKEALNHLGIPNRETGLLEIEDHFSYAEVIDNYPTHKNLIPIAFFRAPSSWLVSRWKWAVQTNFSTKRLFLTSAGKHWMSGVWADSLDIFLSNVLTHKPKIASEYMLNMVAGMDEGGIKHMSDMLEVLSKMRGGNVQAAELEGITNTKKVELVLSEKIKEILKEIDDGEREFISRFKL